MSTRARQKVLTGGKRISHPQLERAVTRAMLVAAPQVLSTSLIGQVATLLNNTEHRAASVLVTYKGLDLQLKRRLDNTSVSARSQRTSAGFFWETYYEALEWSNNELSTFDADSLADSAASNSVAFLQAAEAKQIEGISRALLSDSTSIEPDERDNIPFFAPNHRKFWDRSEFSNTAAAEEQIVKAQKLEDQALAVHNDVSDAIFALGDNGLQGPLISMDDLSGRVLAICHSKETFKVMSALASKTRMGQNGGWENDLAGKFSARWNKKVSAGAKKHAVHFLIIRPGGYPVVPVRSGGTAESFERSALVQLLTQPPEVQRIDNALRPGDLYRTTYVEVDLAFGFRPAFAEAAYELVFDVVEN